MRIYITDEHYEIAAQNGIRKELVYQRVHNGGWDLEKAITVPKQKKPSLYYEYEDLCKEHGVNRVTFINRVSRGVDPHKAATTPTGKRGRRREYLTLEQEAIARQNGLSITTCIERVKRGWTVEQAITLPARKITMNRGTY